MTKITADLSSTEEVFNTLSPLIDSADFIFLTIQRLVLVFYTVTL